MDGKNINIISLIQEYYKWKTKIMNSINSSQITLYSEDCCICEESFINEFEDLLNNFMNRKNYNPNISMQFPKIDEIFINNFSQIIAKLQNNIKLKLINLLTLNIMYNKKPQRNLPLVKFYAGNKRIIIEFKENKDNKALLLINPLEQSHFDYKDKAFILMINKEQKINIFKVILMEKNIYNLLPELIKDGIASSIPNKGTFNTNIYLTKKINNIIGNKNSNTSNSNYNKNNSSKKQSNMNQNNEKIINKKDEDDYKENILKILIYIFYFEKNILETKEEGFNLEEKYYLINQKWLLNYLENYDYSKVLQVLINLSKVNSKINYNNVSVYIKSFVNTLVKKNLINFNKEKSADLENINNIFAIEDNTNYEKFSNCYIIPSKIIELIKNNEFPNANIEHNLKNIYFKKNNIFLSSNKNIIIGNLNEKLFIPKYILSYYNQGIFESEINHLLNDSVLLENYLKSRSCNINNGKKQDLVFNNSSIGYIIFLTKNEKTITSKSVKKIPSKIGINKATKNFSKIKCNTQGKFLIKNKAYNFNSVNPKGNVSLNFKAKNNSRSPITKKKVEIDASKSQNVINNNYTNESVKKENDVKDNSKLKEFNSRITNNNNELEEKIMSFNNKTNEIQNKDEVINNYQKIIDKNKSDFNNLEKKYKLCFSNFKKTKIENEKIKKDLNETKMELGNYKKQNEELRKNLEKLEEENIIENSKTKESSIQKENEELNKELNLIKEELSQKNDELERIQKENLELNKINKKKENNLKNSFIKSREEEYILLKNNYDNLQNELKEKEDEIKLLHQNVENMKNEIKELEEKVKEYEEQIESFEKDKKGNLKEIEDLNQKLTSTQEELEEQRDINNNLKEELDKYQEEKNLEFNDLKMKENDIIRIEKLLKEKDNEIISLKKIHLEIKNDLEAQIKQMKLDYNNLIQEYGRKDRSIQKDLEMINNEKLNIEKKIKFNLEKEKEIDIKLNQLKQEENLIKKEQNDINRQRQQFMEDFKDNKRIKEENKDLEFKKKQLEKEINQIQEKSKYLNSNSSIKKPYLSSKYNSQDIINIINNNNNSSAISNKSDIKQIPPPAPPKIPKPIDTYSEPTKIGLNNIGATCFMNATLECLSQTEDLTNYFLKDENQNKIINNNIAIKNKNEPQLSPIYSTLVHKLWKKNANYKSFSPDKFMQLIEQMNPLFKRGQPGDSKDFIIFLLERFHTELKKPIPQKNINQSQKITSQNLNQYDKINAFMYFFEEFRQECSVISDVFFGITETMNECQNCKKICNLRGQNNNPICYNYQKFNCLIFPLEEVKNLKNNMMRYNNFIQMNNNNRVSLIECFYYNQKSDFFTGQNQNYCNLCKRLSDSIYTSKIYVSPNVLVLILNRGKDNQFNVKLDFTEVIDITEFVLQREKPKIIYQLYGVITHIGKSGPNAHFVASCRSPVDQKWYKYNDAMVTLINDIHKDVIDYGTPYILFYQKI